MCCTRRRGVSPAALLVFTLLLANLVTRPAHAIQNAVMESYNGRMRDELLNQHWWRSIAEAREAVDAYRQDFNEVRPHSALDNKTPSEFARRYAETLNSQRLAS